MEKADDKSNQIKIDVQKGLSDFLNMPVLDKQEFLNHAKQYSDSDWYKKIEAILLNTNYLHDDQVLQIVSVLSGMNLYTIYSLGLMTSSYKEIFNLTNDLQRKIKADFETFDNLSSAKINTYKNSVSNHVKLINTSLSTNNDKFVKEIENQNKSIDESLKKAAAEVFRVIDEKINEVKLELDDVSGAKGQALNKLIVNALIATKAALKTDYKLMLDDLHADLVLSHNENLENIKNSYAELDKESRSSMNLFNYSVKHLTDGMKNFEKQQFKNNTIMVFFATVVSSLLTGLLFKLFIH